MKFLEGHQVVYGISPYSNLRYMPGNYLRDAWRHLIREKGFSAITIPGLALGLAACIFITLFVVDEFGYDRYNTKADRIYRIAAEIHINGPSVNDVATPPAMGTVLEKDFPAVEKAVRIRAQRKDVVVHAGDKAFVESNVVSADPSLFEIFTLPMISGDPKTALSSPNSLVLSASAAKRYFNSTDVLGQTLRLDDDTAVYMVTGVIRDMPAQSHVHLQVIKSLEQGFFQNRHATEMATVEMGDWHVDVNYLPTLEMNLVAGRNFSSQLPTDSGCVLINQTAARVLGYAHPLGQRVHTGADSNSAYTIIGVVKDFNTGSLRNPIDPVVFRLYRDGLFVTFRLSPGNITGTLNAIQNAYAKMANGHPFVYAFLDDEFNRLYLADQRTGRIFTVFSLLSLFIAAIGIFGLVAAATEQRTKELGIRRVLGARMIHLVLLLLRGYGLAIGVAVLIALPTSFWMMHHWLQGFAFRTALHPLLFIVAPLCTIVLAALIVGAKVSRTSGINPARTLRVD